MPEVDFTRGEVINLLPQYELIRDCIDGEMAIKTRGVKYLPQPNSEDKSAFNTNRYTAYVTRAVFYNVTRRTLAGLVGEIFSSPPEVKIPPLLTPMIKDADGQGTTLEQFAKKTINLVIPYSRAGLLADFPAVEGTVSRADLTSGNVTPTMTIYEPWNIINWKTISKRGKTFLSLVVLREYYEKDDDDGFRVDLEEQFRILRINDAGLYTQELWRMDSVSRKFESRETEFMPLDSKGKAFTEIPFRFIGKEDNVPDPDSPEFYDLASINVAHYRNSADYEDSVFMLGQPTPIFTGLNQSWVEEVLNGVIPLGSRAAIPLPVGAAASLLQAAPNTLAKEAMDGKERQMVALGARLVEQKSVQRTATEANQEAASEASSLVSIAQNVSAAIRWALEWCAIFVGAETIRSDATSNDLVFELNTEFAVDVLSPDQIRSYIEAWQKDAISFTEMRIPLRKSRMATLDDKEAKKEMEAEADADLTRSVVEMEAMGAGDEPIENENA